MNPQLSIAILAGIAIFLLFVAIEAVSQMRYWKSRAKKMEIENGHYKKCFEQGYAK